MNNNKLHFDLYTEPLNIKEGQFLKDIMSEIPTNTILSKTLPGLGATTLEIESSRHSIIIEPNVPVIKGKEKKHKGDLFGVYEGITTDDVIDYLLEPTEKYKKLMTTPESFFKIVRAMNALQIDFYKDFMLLFDECDKIVKDISYRSTIALPIEDFFLFENKAFVSATPILPSDPRFEQQDFQVIKIVPDYDYTQKMQLVTTNNVVAIFREILTRCENKDHICIFLNSTDTILAIIKKFNLESCSKVFCSQDSVDKLEKLGYSDAYSNLQFDNNNNVKLEQYTFFTSRFFSAVDIDLSTKPTVIIISDLFYAKHSMIDPHTESVQIIGRFRNGTGGIIHVSNTNRNLSYKTPEQLENYLAGCHETYLQIKQLFKTATNEGVRETLREALERITYAKYIDSEGNKNHFAIDNYFDEERVKSYYIYPSRLKQAYEISEHFTVKYQYYPLPLGDEDRLKISRADNKKERRLAIIEQLDLLNGEEDVYDEPLFKEFRDSLHREDALIVEVYEELGEDYTKDNLMKDKKMNLDLIIHRSKNGKDRFPIMTSVYAVFQEGGRYPVNYIKKELRKIYALYGDNNPYTARKIEEFFKIANYGIKVSGQRGYLLGKKRFS
ncbi:hypothetical protein [Dysgonomonas sp. 520]|uniref:hypothetical protein n=1 Tax=Dysgonomonas sp. 520 TaxID=2302931 RepID=UPI0013D337BD|nr:hypothetical protein [Dysgonomonas sp. 520]NDW09424.1 hypothetical protein [Dysgonomonas sp. 520]